MDEAACTHCGQDRVRCHERKDSGPPSPDGRTTAQAPPSSTRSAPVSRSPWTRRRRPPRSSAVVGRGCHAVRPSPTDAPQPAGAVTSAASRTPPASTAHVNAITGAFQSQGAKRITGTTNMEWTAETANAPRAQPPPITGRRTAAQWRHHSPAATAAMTAITAAPSRARSASVTPPGSGAVEPAVCTLSATAVHPRVAALSKEARTAERRLLQLVPACMEFNVMAHSSHRSDLQLGCPKRCFVPCFRRRYGLIHGVEFSDGRRTRGRPACR